MFDQQEIKRAGSEEVLRQIPAGVMIAEAPSGKILFVNRQAQRMLEQPGRSVPSELGELPEVHDGNGVGVFHPDGRPCAFEEWPLVRTIRSGEEVRDEEINCVLADGIRLWLRCDSSPIYDEEGDLVAGVLLAHDATERKRAEEQLAYHAHLLENVRDAVMATDERLVLTAWNKGAEEMYGWTAGEVLGCDVREVVLWEASDEQRAEKLRELAETGRFRAELVVYRKDGTPVHIEEFAVALRGEQDQVASYLSISRDMTGQKRLETEQQRLIDIVQNSSDFIGIADLEGQATFLNEAGQRLVGLEGLEEVRRTKVLDHFMPEDRAYVRDELFPTIMEEGRWAGELNLRHFETGEPISVIWDAFRIDDPFTGEPISLATVTRDITERKRAEEQLAYHAHLLENMHDTVIATDERFVVTAWNKGTEEMYGWTAGEALGRNIREVTPSEPSDEQWAEVQRELNETGRFRAEWITYRRDGTPLWVEVTSVALQGEQGDITGYLSIDRDVTERKRAEREIEARTRQQAVVAELGLRALENDDLQYLMDDAVILVSRTLGVEYSDILELLPDGEDLLLRAGVGWREGVVGDTMANSNCRSQAGYALLSGEPVIVEDLSEETRFEPPRLLREHAVISSVTVVIDSRDEPFGVLCVNTTSRRKFTGDDVNFLQAVANVLSTAIERKKAEEKLSEVREAERSRIARDLHDEALRDLTYALAESQHVQEISTEAQPVRRLGRLVAALKRVGQQLRGAIYDLNLSAEQDKPFHELLETLVELHRTMAPDCEISLDVRDGLLSGTLGETGRELLRIVGEALTNARRHSGAASVRVSVFSEENTLCAEVSDDGRGFDPA